MPPTETAPLIDPQVGAVPRLRARLDALASGVTRTRRRLDSSGLPLDRFRYTVHRDNNNGNENHFQGIALSGDGEILALSGSNWKDPSADLLLFGSDPLVPEAGPARGLGRLHLDTLLWHAGGIDACGRFLAIALEYPHFTGADPKRFSARVKPPRHGESDRSRIQLVELGPLPRVLPVAIDRPDFLATCVALTRLLNGRFVLLALAHPKRPEPLQDEVAPIPANTVRVDCYLSVSPDPLDGFGQLWSQRVPAAELPNYQTWSLLTDADDGSLLLAAFDGTHQGRIIPFVIDRPETQVDGWQRLGPIGVDVTPGDFRAGGTLAWADSQLRLLATPHFRDPVSGAIEVAELTAAAPVGGPLIAAAQPALLTAANGKGKQQRRLVALRDTLDFRDLMYVPTLVEVPSERPLKEYLREAELPILDQGETSACTGYGLATVIHYLLRQRRVVPDPGCVSPQMIYHMARRYDEWPGERYDGSSCRGGMKAWHKHGVCLEEFWEQDRVRDGGWEDARRRPLGAYFRVNHRDLTAMHSALAEVGILYASATVHEGWNHVDDDGSIPFVPDQEGGHAFAIVAYDEYGFWVQNSWGVDWGKGGFARLSYDDWLENGMDVWVARLGAPSRVGNASTAVGMQPSSKGSRSYFFSDLRPHVISTGNNGEFRTGGTFGTDRTDAERILSTDFRTLTRDWNSPRLLLYAHGGLVSEDGALQRLSDYLVPFLMTELYPIGFIWKTDLWSTVTNILKDAVRQRRPEGFLDDLKDFMLDRLDDALEPVARGLGGRRIWAEMKENAERTATAPHGAFRSVAPWLARERQNDALELHLVGHSAGSIYFARLAQWLTASPETRLFGGTVSGLGAPIDSVTLWAPAVTLALFRETYLPAIRSGMIRRFTLFTLDDTTEKSDHCARVYYKSLLYLVSNALEDRARIPLVVDGVPLLGLEKSIREAADVLALIDQGRIEWVRAPHPGSPSESRAEAHGAFDDDEATVLATLRRILPPGTVLPQLTFAATASARRDRRGVLNEVGT